MGQQWVYPRAGCISIIQGSFTMSTALIDLRHQGPRALGLTCLSLKRRGSFSPPAQS